MQIRSYLQLCSKCFRVVITKPIITFTFQSSHTLFSYLMSPIWLAKRIVESCKHFFVCLVTVIQYLKSNNAYILKYFNLWAFLRSCKKLTITWRLRAHSWWHRLRNVNTYINRTLQNLKVSNFLEKTKLHTNVFVDDRKILW